MLIFPIPMPKIKVTNTTAKFMKINPLNVSTLYALAKVESNTIASTTIHAN